MDLEQFKKGDLVTVTHNGYGNGNIDNSYREEILEFLFSDVMNPKITLVYLGRLKKEFSEDGNVCLVRGDQSHFLYKPIDLVIPEWNIFKYEGSLKLDSKSTKDD